MSVKDVNPRKAGVDRSNAERCPLVICGLARGYAVLGIIRLKIYQIRFKSS